MNGNNAGTEHPIKRYRERVGLSQDELARQIGVTQGMIWRWEQGEEITADRAVSIEEKIGEGLPAEALSATLRRYEELKAKRKRAKKAGSMTLPRRAGRPANQSATHDVTDATCER